MLDFHEHASVPGDMVRHPCGWGGSGGCTRRVLGRRPRGGPELTGPLCTHPSLTQPSPKSPCPSFLDIFQETAAAGSHPARPMATERPLVPAQTPWRTPSPAGKPLQSVSRRRSLVPLQQQSVGGAVEVSAAPICPLICPRPSAVTAGARFPTLGTTLSPYVLLGAWPPSTCDAPCSEPSGDSDTLTSSACVCGACFPAPFPATTRSLPLKGGRADVRRK